MERNLIETSQIPFHSTNLNEESENPFISLFASNNELWFQIVKGYHKGGVYGTGNAPDLYFIPPTPCLGASLQIEYTSSSMSQMMSQYEEDKAAARQR